MDELWVTYDGFLLDDEIFNSLAAIKKRIRVVLVSDSCHSETMSRDINPNYKERRIDRAAVRDILKKNNQTVAGLRDAGKGQHGQL